VIPVVGDPTGVPSAITIVPPLLLTVEIPTLTLLLVLNAPVPPLTRIPADGNGCDVVFVTGVPKLIVKAPMPAVKLPPLLLQVMRSVPPPADGGTAFGPAAIGSVCPVAVATVDDPSGVDKEQVTLCA